jgi:hypothetical protein
MMNSRTLFGCSFLLVNSAVLAVAQQDIHPPQPSGDRPSLEASVKIIEKTLNSIGPVKYVMYLHDDKTARDWKTGVDTFAVSRVRASAESCRIEYHLLIAASGEPILGPSSLESEHSLFLGS